MVKCLRKLLLSVVIFVTLSGAVTAYAAYEDMVSDKADMFSKEEEQAIVETLTNIEKETDVEFMVATITNLGGLTIEDYAEKMFEDVGIGKSDKDNGLLLLISLEDREFRLEVGYGLEGDIPDITAKRIIDTMTDNFKEQKYYAGVIKAIDMTEQYISGERSAEKDAANGFIALIILVIMVIVVIVIIAIVIDSGGSSGSSSWTDSSSSSNDSSSSSSSFDFGGGDSGGGGSSGGW